MQLSDRARERPSELRDSGPLVLPHCDYNLPGFELLISSADDVASVALEEPLYTDSSAHRQLKACGIRLQVARHLVLTGEVVPWSRKRHAIEPVEPGGSEQP